MTTVAISKRCLVICLVIAGLAHGRPAPVAPFVNKLRKGDRERLIAAKLQGQKEVMVLLAARPGMNGALVQEIRISAPL